MAAHAPTVPGAAQSLNGPPGLSWQQRYNGGQQISGEKLPGGSHASHPAGLGATTQGSHCPAALQDDAMKSNPPVSQ